MHIVHIDKGVGGRPSAATGNAHNGALSRSNAVMRASANQCAARSYITSGHPANRMASLLGSITIKRPLCRRLSAATLLCGQCCNNCTADVDALSVQRATPSSDMTQNSPLCICSPVGIPLAVKPCKAGVQRTTSRRYASWTQPHKARPSRALTA